MSDVLSESEIETLHKGAMVAGLLVSVKAHASVRAVASPAATLSCVASCGSAIRPSSWQLAGVTTGSFAMSRSWTHATNVRATRGVAALGTIDRRLHESAVAPATRALAAIIRFELGS
jgi:hypothetical protein